MANQQQLIRFMTLDKCFRDTDELYSIDRLLGECQHALESADISSKDIAVSRRTFFDDIKKMDYDYGMEIEAYTVSGFGKTRFYRYTNVRQKFSLMKFTMKEMNQITDAIEILSRFPDNPQYEWAKNYLSVIQTQQLADEDQNCVEFQDNPNPESNRFFRPLLKAIFRQMPITIKYKKYDSEVKVHEISPYLLKQFNNRWFLLSKNYGFDKLSLYPLDRIQEVLLLSPNKFEKPRREIKEYFRNIVGVSKKEDKPVETVIIRVTKKDYPYVASKPLHFSQMDLPARETEDSVFIRLRVQINTELEAAILSYGANMEVIEPKELRDSIKNKITTLYLNYSKSAE